jgi:hypothetical protein
MEPVPSICSNLMLYPTRTLLMRENFTQEGFGAVMFGWALQVRIVRFQSKA